MTQVHLTDPELFRKAVFGQGHILPYLIATRPLDTKLAMLLQ